MLCLKVKKKVWNWNCYLQKLIKILLLIICSFVITSCASYKANQNELVVLDTNYEIKMRDVNIKVDDGNIVLTPDQYINLTKNINDIKSKYIFLKNKIEFYESQIKNHNKVTSK